MFEAGATLRGLAREYGVAHRTIGLICKKEYREVAEKYNKKNWRNNKKGKKERAEVMREHRKYKNKILKDLIK